MCVYMYIYIYIYMFVCVFLVSLFNGISSFVDSSMPKLPLYKIDGGTN